MDATFHPVTAEELLALGTEARYELVKGELRPMSPAGSEHGRVITRIAAPLATFVSQHQLGEIFGAETGFVLSRNPDTVRAPDVAFVSADRLTKIGNIVEFWPGAPDLAVEVLSPDDRKKDIQEKVRDYLQAGTNTVWIVSPKRRTVTICRLGHGAVEVLEDEEIAADQVIPGFTMWVRDMFPRSSPVVDLTS